VVGILLGLEGVNPEKPDNWGRTPLSLGATHGRIGVVALLESRKA
jgi:ankyrin repeat protein